MEQYAPVFLACGVGIGIGVMLTGLRRSSALPKTTVTAATARLQYASSRHLLSLNKPLNLPAFTFPWSITASPGSNGLDGPDPVPRFDQLDDEKDVHHFLARDMKGGERYSLLISSCVPRPIGLISSQDSSGQNRNLAPFSYFTVVSHAPALCILSVCRNGDGSKKDTLHNIESSGEFVVNIISESYVDRANECATPFEYGVDEMAHSGLHPVASHIVNAPRCKEACVTYECKVFSMQDIHVNDAAPFPSEPADDTARGSASTTLIIGEIVMIHVADKALDKDTMSLDLEQLRPVSRLGGVLYGSSSHVYPLPRKPKPTN